MHCALDNGMRGKLRVDRSCRRSETVAELMDIGFLGRPRLDPHDPAKWWNGLAVSPQPDKAHGEA